MTSRTGFIQRCAAIIQRHAGACFVLVLIGVVALCLVRVFFFLQIWDDDAFHINIARNLLLHGRPAVDTWGDLMDRSRYELSYPPLHPAILALAFRMFGVSYEVARIVPILFFTGILLLCFTASKRNAGALAGLMSVLLLAFDQAFFLYAGSNRPEMTAAFLFTAAALLYLRAQERPTLRRLAWAGAVSGLACLSSLNCFWLPLAVLLHQLVSRRLFRQPREFLCYLAVLLLVIAPYYGWLAASEERRAIFLRQVAWSTSMYRGVSAASVFRAMLNPLADLYVQLFWYHSAYPVIFLVVMAAMLIRRMWFFVLLFGVPVAMMMVTERTERYLLITMPMLYLCMGALISQLASWMGRACSARTQGLATAAVAAWVGLNALGTVRQAVKEPEVRVNVGYYRDVLEAHTRPASRIATDLTLYLSATEQRKILTVTCLIWDRFAYFYPYQEVVQTLDADYILLTDPKKAWGEQDRPQAAKFRQLLQTDYRFVKGIPAYAHGSLWLYERRDGDSRG